MPMSKMDGPYGCQAVLCIRSHFGAKKVLKNYIVCLFVCSLCLYLCIFTFYVCSFTLYRFSLKLPTIKNPFKEERKLEMWTKKILNEQEAVSDLSREKIREIR